MYINLNILQINKPNFLLTQWGQEAFLFRKPLNDFINTFSAYFLKLIPPRLRLRNEKYICLALKIRVHAPSDCWLVQAVNFILIGPSKTVELQSLELFVRFQ